MAGHLRDKLFFGATIAILAVATLSYYVLQAPTDPRRCKVLLEDGFWLNPSQLLNWQPAGCMMHTYRPQEAETCLQDRRAVFVGGISSLHLLEATAKQIDPDYSIPSLEGGGNLGVGVAGVRFEFVWDPSLDSKDLAELRADYEKDTNRPALVVIGPGLEYLSSQSDLEVLTDRIGTLMSGFGTNGAMLGDDAVVMAPLWQSNSTNLSPDASNLVTGERLERMNQAIEQLTAEPSMNVALAYNQIAATPGALDGDNHPTAKAAAVMASILLNLRCNTRLEQHYPFASTCCNSYPRPSWVQLFGFVFVTGFIPIAVLLYKRGYSPRSSMMLRLLPAAEYHRPILVMGLTVVLCYYCDRTNILGKEQKQTDPSQFFIGMIIIIVASLFTLKTEDKDLAFLNRDQTDEWKGWMQVAILVYHYVGVSKTEYIYNYMRVCPTSYLFMTGFGHTCYFLKKGDYSFKRFVATMLRLNLLNIILAYAMGNDWLLYYFAPLVTWNFFVIFGLLWFKHDKNSNSVFLFSKMIVAALLNTAFYRTPGALEYGWWLLQTLFRMQGDLREWRFRVTLDQYSVFPGMVFGVLFVNWGTYSLPKSPWWNSIRRGGCIVSVIIMLGYAVFEMNQPSKIIYNQKHTYVSWLPCCAFVILRNATPWLRRTHNKFFAWVGRGSLETFLLQFHIWLAADTAGLLVVGPPHYRFVNAAISTPIFFYLASAVTSATGGVIEWIMSGQPKAPRPAMPASQASHPANIPQANGSTHEKGAPMVALKEANGEITSALPINGQPAEVKVQDPSALEKGLSGGGAPTPSRISTAAKDLRVRIGVMMAAMLLFNWTYYF